MNESGNLVQEQDISEYKTRHSSEGVIARLHPPSHFKLE